jgi:hypothetical protein
MKAEYYITQAGVFDWRVYLQIERNPRVRISIHKTRDEAERALARIAKHLESLGTKLPEGA